MTNHTSEDRALDLAAFEAAFGAMRQAFAELAAQDRSGARDPDAEPATVGQAARHVADWDRFETAALARMADGEPASSDDEGVVNVRWLLDSFYVDTDDALSDLDAAHAGRAAMLRELSDDEWKRFGSASARGGREHYRSHTDHPCEFPINREEAMRLLRDARDALLARLTTEVTRGGAAQSDPGGVSLGAGIAHVARWDEGAVTTLRARATDPSAPDPYANRDREWNERWLKEDADARPTEALQRLKQASAALIDVLREAEDDLWHRDGPRFALGTAVHYRSHADEPLAIPLPTRQAGSARARPASRYASQMAHYVFNFSGGGREGAVALMRANLWGIGREEQHGQELASGDLALIYVASERVFIGRAELASPVHDWTSSEAAALPGDSPSGVVLSHVEEWDPVVSMEAVVGRIDPTGSNPLVQENAAAGFRTAVVQITEDEYEAAVGVTRQPRRTQGSAG